MKKKIIALIMAVITLFFALSLNGCTILNLQGKNTLTLMLKKSDSEKVYLQKIIKLYETKTDNKIKLILIDNESFDKTVEKTFSGNNLPDLFFSYNGSLLHFLNVEKNFSYLNGEKWVSELTDDVYENCIDGDGNVLGLPFWENSLSGCYYNKTIFDSLGLKPATTQTEFDALCAALKSAGHTPLYWAADSCNWMFQFGLDPIFADNPELLEKLNKNEITYADIPAVTNMVSWLYNANRKGWINADYASRGWDDIAPTISSGGAALIFSWDTFFGNNIESAGGKYTVKDFAVMPVFMNTADSGTYEGGNMNMLMVTKNSPRIELAKEFLNFCAEPENYNAAFEGVFTLNCFKNQTTNIQSQMVADASLSIEKNRRVSTARPKIIGYQQNDVGKAVLKMFQGEVDVTGCVRLMDEYRVADAEKMGVKEFVK